MVETGEHKSKPPLCGK